MLSQHSHSMLVLLRWLVCVFWLLGWSKKCRPESHAVVVFCSIKQLWHAVIWDPLMVHSGFRVACYLPLSLQQSCKWTQDPWNLNLFLLNYFSIGYNQPKFLCWYLLIVEERKNRPNPFITYVPLLSQWCISTVRLEGYKHRFGARGYLVGGLGSGKGDVFLGWLVMCVLLVIDLLVPYPPIPSASGFGVGFGRLNTFSYGIWSTREYQFQYNL